MTWREFLAEVDAMAVGEQEPQYRRRYEADRTDAYYGAEWYA